MSTYETVVYAVSIPHPYAGDNAVEFAAIDEMGEWIAHESAAPEETEKVLKNFAGLAPKGASLRCDSRLATVGRRAGWNSHKGKGSMEERRRLVSLALSFDPHCANRLPLGLLANLLDVASAYQCMRPWRNARFQAGHVFEATSSYFDFDADESEEEEDYQDARAAVSFWGPSAETRANGLHVRLMRKGKKPKIQSIFFSQPGPNPTYEQVGIADTCLGLVPLVSVAGEKTADFPPTARDVLSVIAHMELVLRAYESPEGASVETTAESGDLVIEAASSAKRPLKN